MQWVAGILYTALHSTGVDTPRMLIGTRGLPLDHYNRTNTVGLSPRLPNRSINHSVAPCRDTVGAQWRRKESSGAKQISWLCGLMFKLYFDHEWNLKLSFLALVKVLANIKSSNQGRTLLRLSISPIKIHNQYRISSLYIDNYHTLRAAVNDDDNVQWISLFHPFIMQTRAWYYYFFSFSFDKYTRCIRR